MNDYRILVVDDEEDLCEILKFNLENEGYEVDTANSAEEAMKMDISSYHLILLDVMMGEISGFKMANILKKDKKTAKVPIIFITAKDTENDTVTGFNLGADDYISKPFSLREVIARVKAVLRRTTAIPAKSDIPEVNIISYPDLEINMNNYSVNYMGKKVDMPPKEIELLHFLAASPNQVFTREQLLELIWGYEYSGETRTVDVHVRNLRKKIEKDPDHPQYIQRGVPCELFQRGGVSHWPSLLFSSSLASLPVRCSISISSAHTLFHVLEISFSRLSGSPGLNRSPKASRAARFSPASSRTRTCPKAMTLRNSVVYFSGATRSWAMTQKEHFPSRRMASSLWPALAQWKYSLPLWYT